jgi:iron complex transport system substrate-binding protein
MLQKPILLFTTALLLLSACALPSPPAMQPTVAVQPAETKTNAGYPLTIQNCGRTLTFDKAPVRVVATYQPATDTLLALGLEDKIVIAGGNYGTVPIPPLREAFAKLGAKVQEKIPQRETMLAAQPDLVVSTDPGYDFDPANGNATIENLAGIGAQAYAFQHRCGTEFTSGKIADGETDILNLGRIFGIEDRAKAYVAAQQAMLADVASRTAGRTPINAIIYGSGEGPVNVYAGGLFAELIEKAGGKNLFADLGKDYGPVSLEEFATKQPDIYIVVGTGAEAEAKAKYLFKQFPEHPASKAKRWISVGDNQFYAGVSSAYTVEQFARAFHPAAFAAASAAAQPATAFPVTIQNCGVTTTFTKAPERVVAMNHAATEILLALGLAQRIAGHAYPDDDVLPEYKADYDRLTLLSKQYPQREVVAAANPDFIFAGLRSAFENEAAGPRADWQKQTVNTYLAAEFCEAEGSGKQTAPTLDTLYGDIRNIGKIFGISARAEAYVAELQKQVDDTAKALGSITSPVKVMIFDSAEPTPYVVGNTAMAHTLLTLAGGQNVFGDIAERYPEVSWEAVAERSADVIVILDYSGQTAQQKIDVLKEKVGDLSPAVKNERFVVVKLADVLTSIRNPRAVRQMAEAFYPDKFGNVAAVAAAYPVTIQNCGRTLTFAKAPARVVSLWQPQNELLLALGLQDRIIAFAGMYAPLPPELAERAQGIKEIGSSIAWPTREVLLSEKPDLVVSELIEGFAFDDKQGRATAKEIEATGANVYSASACVVPDYAKKNVDTVFADIENFGKVFGVQDRAAALIAQLKQKNDDVVAKVKGRAPVKVAFYNGGEGPLNVLSGGVWGDAVTRAGGQSVFPLDAFQVSNEEFAAAQPDVILVGTFPGQDAATLIAFLKKTFPNIPAVKADRMIEVPTIEVEAGVRVMDGLERIAKALHPEAFK